jgi:hypothetical protein
VFWISDQILEFVWLGNTLWSCVLSQLQWERPSSRSGGFNPIGETLVLAIHEDKRGMGGGQESVCIYSGMFVRVFILRRRDIAAVITPL